MTEKAAKAGEETKGTEGKGMQNLYTEYKTFKLGNICFRYIK